MDFLFCGEYNIAMTKRTKGILYLILSAFFFAAMAVFVRLGGDIPFTQKAFFRNSVSFVIALILLLRERSATEDKSVFLIPKGALLYLLLRSIGGSIGIFGNFYAIDRLVLSDASILNKMSPFFAIFFSFVLLREKIKPIPLAAICVAFLGSMLIVKPSFDFSKMLPTLAGFFGGVGAGLAYACLRKLSLLKCNGKIVVLFFSAFSMLVSVPFLIFNFVPMSAYQVLMLCMAGTCAAGGQFSITAAYFNAPAKEISIYDYTQIIFSAGFGFFIFGQIPDFYSILGYVIIISMAILNFIYHQKQQKFSVGKFSGNVGNDGNDGNDGNKGTSDTSIS